MPRYHGGKIVGMAPNDAPRPVFKPGPTALESPLYGDRCDAEPRPPTRRGWDGVDGTVMPIYRQGRFLGKVVHDFGPGARAVDATFENEVRPR